ncbi:hypothetical protein ACLOAV_008411 [Pseudogymnoascus australis]
MALFNFIICDEGGNCAHRNLANGCREYPIEIEDEEATTLNKKPTCVNKEGTLSRLPTELLVKIMFNLPDRRTLLHVSLLSRQFQRLFGGSRKWDYVLSAYTNEDIQGQHTLTINATTSRINGHLISTSKFCEGFWKALCWAKRWKNAVDFLIELDRETYKRHYDVEKSLQTTCQWAHVDGTWEAWAAVFTAANYLQQECDITMRQWVRDRVVVGWRDIVGQSVFTCQWKDVCLVSEQLQRYLRENSNEQAEVVQATLDLAVREHEWQDASCHASRLIELNANTRQVVHILETICNHAILEGQWSEANRALSVLGAIRDGTDVGEELMSTLQNMWDQIAPQAFQNQWNFALDLAKHLVRQLKIRNRNSEVERILQTLWDEAVRKHDWDSATIATKIIVPLQGEQTIPMLKSAWREEYGNGRWKNAFAVAWNIVWNDSNGAVQMLETMWEKAIEIGLWTEAFRSASQLLDRRPRMSYNEVVVMLQSMWDSAVNYKGLVSHGKLAAVGGELKSMIGDFDSEWEQSMQKQRWGTAFAKGYHILNVSWRLRTGTSTNLLLWMIQHHVGLERQREGRSYLRDLSAKWGLVKVNSLSWAY